VASGSDRTVAAVAGCVRNHPGKEPQCPRRRTFGRYAEIPYDEMTPEQQEGYIAFYSRSAARPAGPARSGYTTRSW